MIQDIINEITAKLKEIPDSVAYEWDVERVATTPAILVGVPERVEYRTSYGRGKKITITAVVLIGKANARAAAKKLLKFVDNTGPESVFRMIDSQYTDYTTCDDVTVVQAEPDIFVNAGISYLGAEFSIDVTSTGA